MAPSPADRLRAALADLDPLDHTCPRCGEGVRERFYGPCCSCRSVLRVEQGAEARSVEAEVYEPKMNVTPNAVATKE